MEYELVLLVLLPASLFDLSRYRIPNAVPVAGLIISLTRHLELQGITGFRLWLMGSIVPFILVYILFRLGVFGASDGKLAAAIGGFVGLPGILFILIYSLFAGAVLGIIKLIANRRFFDSLHRIKSIIYDTVFLKKISKEMLERTEKTVIPYGVALSLGTLLYGCFSTI